MQTQGKRTAPTSPPGTFRGDIVMTNGEIMRLRRQMQRRIRAVVAERRMARQSLPVRPHDGDPAPEALESAAQHTAA